MLDRIIAFSLRNRMLVLVAAIAMVVLGTYQAISLPIDVFPNLNRARVVVITEAPGMAPEEVETLITFPLETALNGAAGVMTVRSSSGSGISVIYVEFDWDTDIYIDRQVVAERLQLASERLPDGINPTLAPVSSIMGQVLMVGMWSETGQTSPMEVRSLADWVVRQRLMTIPGVSQVFTIGGGRLQYQVLVDPDAMRSFDVTMAQVEAAVVASNRNATGGYLDDNGPNEILVRGIGRIQTLDDLRSVPLSSEFERPVTLGDVAEIVQAPQPKRGDASVLVRDLQTVTDGKGASEVNGGAAVVLTINKQPGVDTRRIDRSIRAAMVDLRRSLPADIRVETVYSQSSFIERAIENVVEALADGGVLVLVILFMFLLSFRTTFITLTAIPLSILTTAIVFTALDLSINTMTLGGIAVAIGELVDDAIVDVENIYRRLRENRLAKEPRSPLKVVFDASIEVRSSIVYGTAIVVLVFLPLLALEGIEGKLFVPLAIGYIVSLLASLAVSLTVTPVLSSFLLVGRRGWMFAIPFLAAVISALAVFWVIPRAMTMLGLSDFMAGHPWFWFAILLVPIVIAVALLESWLGSDEERDGVMLLVLKRMAGWAIGFSLKFPSAVLIVAATIVFVAAMSLRGIERDFLPPFNEGSVQVNAILAPGTSLQTSSRVGEMIDKRLMKVEGVRSLVRRTGRAELDEHAEGVNVSELVLELDDGANRAETIALIRGAMSEIPGVISSTEQPMAHLISHMLSGVKAQIGVKIYGDDLGRLRQLAQEMENRVVDIDGLKDIFVEPQTNIPQLRIELDRESLRQFGMSVSEVMGMVETALGGRVVGNVLVGQRTYDLVVRLQESFREDQEKLRRLSITTPSGAIVPLEQLAKIYEGLGPNSIRRENVRRRIILQANVAGRGLVDVVQEMQNAISEIELPDGYFIEYGGEFESQASATRRLAILSLIALVGMFMVLYTLFGSVNLALQVLAALPAAMVGAVAALILTDQNLTVAAMVGFISLCGIASRNGILLLSHYRHLVEHEGESWSPSMIRRAGQERLAPVLMTALTSGIGLLPLALAAGQPGKEILYPVATVIIGGLLTSTLAEFFVRPALFWVCHRKSTDENSTF